MDSEQVKLPKFLSDRCDVKAESILTFHTAYSSIAQGKIEGASTDAQVMLVTPQGIVSGTICVHQNSITEEDFQQDPSLVIENIAFTARNENLKELQDEAEDTLNVVNNSAIITVRDAILTPWATPNNTFKFKVLYLFASDISGFTIGTPNL